MVAASSGLAGPPDEPGALDGFPAAAPVETLHRLSEHPEPWWFSTVAGPEKSGGGRFDLEAPQGTCSLAESLDGALVETLLRTPVKVVVAERLDELFHAVVAVRMGPVTADLTAPAATRFGFNAEVHATLDYTVPRRWAAALRRRGWRALRHRLRGDVSQAMAGRALFGRAGLRTRSPAGMRTRVAPLDIAAAEQALAVLGMTVRPIPSEVPIQPPG